MSATIKIYELTASMAGVDKTASRVRFKLADDQTVDNNNPVTVPSTGVTRSFTKQLRLFCATAPDVQVDNLTVYTGGNAIGTGVSINASNVGITFAANATAALADSSDVFSYTSVAPLNLDGVDSAAITATGFGGDILKLQLEATPSASAGRVGPATLFFAYDEV